LATERCDAGKTLISKLWLDFFLLGIWIVLSCLIFSTITTAQPVVILGACIAAVALVVRIPYVLRKLESLLKQTYLLAATGKHVYNGTSYVPVLLVLFIRAAALLVGFTSLVLFENTTNNMSQTYESSATHGIYIICFVFATISKDIIFVFRNYKWFGVNERYICLATCHVLQFAIAIAVRVEYGGMLILRRVLFQPCFTYCVHVD
jgi:hypothetical protein